MCIFRCSREGNVNKYNVVTLLSIILGVYGVRYTYDVYLLVMFILRVVVGYGYAFKNVDEINCVTNVSMIIQLSRLASDFYKY